MSISFEFSREDDAKTCISIVSALYKKLKPKEKEKKGSGVR